MDNTLVRVNGVTKIYYKRGEKVPVLQGIDLDVPSGDFMALMGPSGSGKTTLLNLIGGLDRPSSGQVQVGNDEISRMSPQELAAWRSRHIGLVFQFYHLIPVLTAAQNVELPLLLTRLGRAQRQKHVATALNIVGLGDRAKHRPTELSGGQQQRVAIARAIVSDPDLILADEPTGDLDAQSAEEIMDLLCDLVESHGKTIMLVTHDPRAAGRAKRTLHLDKGTLMHQEVA